MRGAPDGNGHFGGTGQPPLRVALIGAGGMLAQAVRQTAPEGIELLPFDLPAFDLTDPAGMAVALEPLRPQLLINCAAFTRVDACESEAERAFAVNGAGPGHLAALAQRLGATLVHLSTDFVFSGAARRPYCEEDAPGPLSVYGRSKLQGERAVVASGLSQYYIVRTSWLYGPGGANFVETVAHLAAEREELGIVADQQGTPTFSVDLAAALWRLVGLRGGAAAPFGLYHYSNAGCCSWYDFACAIVEQLRALGSPVRARQIRPLRTAEYPVPARRPAYSVLAKDKICHHTGIHIPDWRTSLATYLRQRHDAAAQLSRGC